MANPDAASVVPFKVTSTSSARESFVLGPNAHYAHGLVSRHVWRKERSLGNRGHETSFMTDDYPPRGAPPRARVRPQPPAEPNPHPDVASIDWALLPAVIFGDIWHSI